MTVPKITRGVLLNWAAEHRANAKHLREQAARLIYEAEEAERKAADCQRDADEMVA